MGTEQGPELPDTRVYLGVVLVLSTLTVALLVGLYLSGFQSFLDSFLQEPAQAVQDDPFSPLLVVFVTGTIVLLMAVIVFVGARYDQVEVDEPR